MRMPSSSRWSWTHCVSTRTSVAYALTSSPSNADLLLGISEPSLVPEQPPDRLGRPSAPGVAVRRGGVEHLERDVPRRPRPADDHLALLAVAERDGALGLVQEAAHRGVDDLLAQHPQPAAVQL